jgi:hypothetical protein
MTIAGNYTAEITAKYSAVRQRLMGQPRVVNVVRAFTVVEQPAPPIAEEPAALPPPVVVYAKPTPEMKANEPKAHLLSRKLWMKWEGRRRSPEQYLADICTVFGTNRRDIKSRKKSVHLVAIRHHIWQMTAEEYPNLSTTDLSRLFNRHYGAIKYVLETREIRREQMRAYNERHPRGKAKE